MQKSCLCVYTCIVRDVKYCKVWKVYRPLFDKYESCLLSRIRPTHRNISITTCGFAVFGRINSIKNVSFLWRNQLHMLQRWNLSDNNIAALYRFFGFSPKFEMFQEKCLDFFFNTDLGVWFSCENIDKSCIKVFANTTFPYNILIKITHGRVCLSESQQWPKVCDLIAASHSINAPSSQQTGGREVAVFTGYINTQFTTNDIIVIKFLLTVNVVDGDLVWWTICACWVWMAVVPCLDNEFS